MQTEQALAYLQQHDAVFHIDMLEAIRRGLFAVVAAEDTGVLLQEPQHKACMLTVEDSQTAFRFLDMLGSASMAVAHQPFYLDEIERRFGLTVHLECHQAAWLGGDTLPLPDSPFTLRILDETFAPTVQQMYSNPVGLDYILDRLGNRAMLGAFDGDTLAGFIGTHFEGSIGLLEVAPAYRRQGLATALIHEELRKGHVPFSQFEVSNHASRKLHEKMGMSISEKTMFWME